MRISFSKGILFLAICLCSSLANAQISKLGKKMYPKFQTLASQADTNFSLVDSALSMGIEIFKAEQEAADKKMDTLFMAMLCDDLGALSELNYEYEAAAPYYLLAGTYYQKINKDLEAGISISKYLLSYEVVRLTRVKKDAMKPSDSIIFDRGKADTTIWISTSAREMRRSAEGDTLFVKLNGGKAQNVTIDSKLDVFTTFDTFYAIKRNIIKAGTGFITQINDFTCEGYVVLEPDFDDTIYDNDAWEIKVDVDKRFVTSQIAKIAAYNIKLFDHNSDRYLIGGEGNLTINAERFEKPLILAMLDEFQKSIPYYDSTRPGVLDNMIDEGRFGGMTYRQCLQSATYFDVTVFIDYIGSYPARSINTEKNIIAVFIQWALDGAYTGKSEQEVFDSIFYMPNARLMDNYKVWGEYYKTLTKPDSVMMKMNDDRYELYPEKKIALLEKMLELSKAVNNKTSDSFYTIHLVYQYYNVKKYKVALEYSDKIWDRLYGFHKQLIALYKGVFYSNLNNSTEAIRYLDSSLAIDSNYFYAQGYKGWNLIKLGRLKDAFPYCEYARNWDSSVAWTNINMAHAYLLRGNKGEANRLYKKSFEFMSVPSDYYEGLQTDFDYFINSGLNELEFKELKKFYTDYYNTNWKNRIYGDSLKSRGTNYEDKEEYTEALRLMNEAGIAYLKDAKPEWDKVRSVYRWMGYLHYKKKEYRDAVVFYKKASVTTIEHSLGDDNLISDYDDISNVYDWLDDTTREMEYRSRASSLEVALREKRDPKRLYIVMVGTDYSNHNDTFSLNDARELSNALKNSGNLYFDSISDYTFIGKNANSANLKRALDTAIYTLGDNDVFLFYYSGFGRSGENEGLQLSDGLFTLRDLSGYLSQVPAGRQIHIADCNGLNWREWYQRGTFGLLSSEKRSLMFLGLKNARIEEKSMQHSVLTDALLKGLTMSLNDGAATATEWFSNAASYLLGNDRLYALEMQSFGHDFTIGRSRIVSNSNDTVPPVIELYGATATRGENISVVNTKGPLAGRITDNSRIAAAYANGIALYVAANGRFELPKELLGLKNITITASDEYGNTSFQEFVVSQSEATKSSESNRYAYLFASKDYEYWNDLKNPVFDAEKIGELLESYYGYKVTIIRNPSRFEVTEKLDQIRRFKFKPNDQLFVFFAGHGLYDSVWGGYYVCPESKLPKDDKYYESYYPQQKIADLIDGCAARNVFLVMDVCFGGKMFDKIEKHDYIRVNDGNEISTDDYITRQLEIPCRQFLTSGGNNYVEDGVAGSHSPFAGRFITALEESAMKKEYITASEVTDYLRTMKTLGNDKKSFPRYGFFGGDKDAEYVLKVVRKMRSSAVIAGL